MLTTGAVFLAVGNATSTVISARNACEAASNINSSGLAKIGSLEDFYNLSKLVEPPCLLFQTLPLANSIMCVIFKEYIRI